MASSFSPSNTTASHKPSPDYRKIVEASPVAAHDAFKPKPFW